MKDLEERDDSAPKQEKKKKKEKKLKEKEKEKEKEKSRKRRRLSPDEGKVRVSRFADFYGMLIAACHHLSCASCDRALRICRLRSATAKNRKAQRAEAPARVACELHRGAEGCFTAYVLAVHESGAGVCLCVVICKFCPCGFSTSAYVYTFPATMGDEDEVDASSGASARALNTSKQSVI